MGTLVITVCTAAVAAVCTTERLPVENRVEAYAVIERLEPLREGSRTTWFEPEPKTTPTDEAD